MRTWTLERQWSGSIVVFGNTEKLEIHGPVEVIELGPVLDLLERAYVWIEDERKHHHGATPKPSELENALLTVLHAHGRLDG